MCIRDRFNYDLPDNDDDRLADASGEINPNLVRRDRAIPGDTVINTIRGTFLNGSDVDLMTVQFESHSADHGVDGGVILDFSKNFGLFLEDGIQPLSASVRIVDASTGNIFECEVGDPFEINDTLAYSFSIVNTEPLVLFCLLYTSPSPRDATLSRMPSSA